MSSNNVGRYPGAAMGASQTRPHDGPVGATAGLRDRPAGVRVQVERDRGLFAVEQPAVAVPDGLELKGRGVGAVTRLDDPLTQALETLPLGRQSLVVVEPPSGAQPAPRGARLAVDAEGRRASRRQVKSIVILRR